jgi:hypothetical protein
MVPPAFLPSEDHFPAPSHTLPPSSGSCFPLSVLPTPPTLSHAWELKIKNKTVLPGASKAITTATPATCSLLNYLCFFFVNQTPVMTSLLPSWEDTASAGGWGQRPLWADRQMPYCQAHSWPSASRMNHGAMLGRRSFPSLWGLGRHYHSILPQDGLGGPKPCPIYGEGSPEVLRSLDRGLHRPQKGIVGDSLF